MVVLRAGWRAACPVREGGGCRGGQGGEAGRRPEPCRRGARRHRPVLRAGGREAHPRRALDGDREVRQGGECAVRPPDVAAELGRFRRNGTIYRIPFLTTSPRFTQRLGIVNRGAAAAAYSVGELHAQSGVTAAAGARASGALPPGQTVLMASDIVTITGGTRGAASISIVADPSIIDASIDIIHPETGTIDTVHLN